MNKGRKTSGGKYHANRKKKSYERKGQENIVILGEPKSKKLRTHGGFKEIIQLKNEYANVSTLDGIQKVEITNVLKTPQNRFWARQNKLMKGVIIETSIGKAKISNRPPKENVVNAILLKE